MLLPHFPFFVMRISDWLILILLRVSISRTFFDGVCNYLLGRKSFVLWKFLEKKHEGNFYFRFIIIT